MAFNLDWILNVSANASADTKKYGEVVVAETTFTSPKVEKLTLTIADAATFTFAPQSLLGTAIHFVVIVSDKPLTIRDLPELSVTARVVVIGNNNATTGLTLGNITMQNGSGATATVEILLGGA